MLTTHRISIPLKPVSLQIEQIGLHQRFEGIGLMNEEEMTICSMPHLESMVLIKQVAEFGGDTTRVVEMAKIPTYTMREQGIVAEVQDEHIITVSGTNYPFVKSR